ncbi:MAG: GntR family transcriptional regulator [Sedimentisphaerales bacterium]|nr:GntR family transcriptional regulator [Sedimentisphaerales bacterium]
MALWIQISAGSGEPIYAQVVEQVGQAIARGELAGGDKLPTVRKLAAELVINPNTVARAYSSLERAGLVTTKTGSGTFVSDPKLRKSDGADVNILTERMDTLIARGLNLGLEAGDLTRLFERRLAKYVKTPQQQKEKNDE